MQVAIRIIENDGPASAFQFTAPAVLLVGRHSDCDLRLEGDLVSRKHARIMLGSTSFIVEDLSANGTEISPSQKLHGERRELDYGAELRIGPFALTVGDVPVPSPSRAAAATPAREPPASTPHLPPPVPPPARRTAPPLPPAAAAAFIPRAPAGAGSSFPPPPGGSLSIPTPHALAPHSIPSPLPPRLVEAGSDGTLERALFGLYTALRPLLDDPTVSLVMIDGPTRVSLERRGEVESTDIRFPSAKALVGALRAAAQFAGKPFDEDNPILEARLPDGYRLTAVLPPAARGGPSLTIRRASRERVPMARMVEAGSLTAGSADLLASLVGSGHNVLVAGPGASGKTTLLEALAGSIPEAERVILVEEQAELDLRRERLVALEASARASVRQLLAVAALMRPDRLVVGELRGAEARDLVLAMTSGRGGFLSSVRAASAREALARVEAMTLLGDPASAASATPTRALIASAVQILVSVARLRDGTRRVTHITELAGEGAARGGFDLRDLYVRAWPGKAPGAPVVGALAPTGLLPTRLEQLTASGYDLPREMHEAAARLSAALPAERRP
jgi:pilus assembly protein CpaF